MFCSEASSGGRPGVLYGQDKTSPVADTHARQRERESEREREKDREKDTEQDTEEDPLNPGGAVADFPEKNSRI